MPASSGNRFTARKSRQRLSVTPAVTTVRRGSHRPAVAPATATGTVPPVASRPAAGLGLISSARGVRLSPR